MAIKMDLQIVGAKNLARMWDRISHHYAKDLRPIWRVIRKWWDGTRLRGFETEGSSIGSPWPELGAIAEGGPPGDYGRWKAEHHPGQPLLVLTGAFRDAVTKRGKGAWSKMRPQWMKAGIQDFVYWATHRWGWTARHIPRRDYVAVSSQNLSDLDKDMQCHMNDTDRKLEREFGGVPR